MTACLVSCLFHACRSDCAKLNDVFSPETHLDCTSGQRFTDSVCQHAKHHLFETFLIAHHAHIFLNTIGRELQLEVLFISFLLQEVDHVMGGCFQRETRQLLRKLAIENQVQVKQVVHAQLDHFGLVSDLLAVLADLTLVCHSFVTADGLGQCFN